MTQANVEGIFHKINNTQEAEKTKLALLPAYIPQTTKLKQKPWKQQQPTLKSALMLLSVVLLTDALSVLQALQSNRDTNHNDLSTAFASLCRSHAFTLLWILAHYNVPGNEAADTLAKESTTKEQVDRSTSYPEVKTILKAKQQVEPRAPMVQQDWPLLPFI